ncbi:hypothetical protein [Crenobacter caeni]|uniref:Lipoprotein n=1 Tax=Crenobacter caeni TaxID=2705474 RepID=A0A6B2KRW3_9NEIS|nr:hypothetical protein [Crenobacter caeni]NDV12986.1 hypothetical protein [Crenobacter caeni]
MKSTCYLLLFSISMTTCAISDLGKTTLSTDHYWRKREALPAEKIATLRACTLVGDSTGYYISDIRYSYAFDACMLRNGFLFIPNPRALLMFAEV